MLSRVGVIIIGRNEGERLERAIKSVQKVGLRAIYVDSASSDNSIEIAKSNAVPYIELSSERPLSAARARNAGFKWLAENIPDLSYVHMLDGDCDLNPGWINSAVSVLDCRAEVAVVCGRLREVNWQGAVFRLLSDVGWYIKPGEIQSCGGIATVRADIFQKVGGFNENLIAGEEPEFYQRIRQKGYKLLCLENEMGRHDSGITNYAQWWTRSVRTGFSYANAQEWGRWQKARRSLVFWGGMLPALIILSVFLSPVIASLLIMAYPLQMIRIYTKLTIPYAPKHRMLFAIFCVLDKFPEFLGFLKYHYAKITGKQQTIIEYKNRKETD